jgi:methionyl-tRNA formyltransferase
VTSNNRIVVCAYHNVGYRCLAELLRQGARVESVFTHEDSPTEEIWFASVRELAEKNHIPCYTSDVNEEKNIALLRNIRPDFIFSFYYRYMIKKEILDIPRRGALNMHGSYLPKYRGRVPVNWVVINGETETGATLHYMVEKPDAGDMVDRVKVSISFTDTAFDVFNKVTEAAEQIITRTWPLLREGKAQRVPMNLAEGSYFSGRRPADGLINWGKEAVAVYNLVRGVTHPYPGAFSFLDGKKVIAWRAWPVDGKGEPGEVVSEAPLLVGTGRGLLEILSLQIDGKDEIPASDFIAGNPIKGKKFRDTQ